MHAIVPGDHKTASNDMMEMGLQVIVYQVGWNLNPDLLQEQQMLSTITPGLG